MNIIIPVSYTQLDVYKRQVKKMTKSEMAKNVAKTWAEFELIDGRIESRFYDSLNLCIICTHILVIYSCLLYTSSLCSFLLKTASRLL